MIAKLVTWGKDRQEAIERMLRAIAEYRISGVETTLPFCRFVLEHQAFTSGNFDTHFIAKYFTPDKLFAVRGEEQEIASILGAAWLSGQRLSLNTTVENGSAVSAWKTNRLSKDQA